MNPSDTLSLSSRDSSTQWFFRQLAWWSALGIVSAAPCVFLARSVDFDTPIAHLAMLCGIFTHVLLLSAFTSTPWWKRQDDTLLGKSLRVSLLIRASMAGLGALFYAVGPHVPGFIPGMEAIMAIMGFLTVPEMMSGMMALGMLNVDLMNGPTSPDFALTFAATLLTGLLLEVAILAVTPVIWTCLSVWKRSRLFQSVTA